MRIERREDLLKIGVAVVIGLALLDRMVLTPAATRWKAQGERITALQAKVTEGRRLLLRKNAIRAKWAEMQQTDLKNDVSEAEEQVYTGIQQWAAASGISTTSLSPLWRPQEDYDLYEFRASTTGTQSSLGKFIYQLETDKLPVKLEECELTARDNKGQQLTGALRFSFIRLKVSDATP